MDTRTWDQAGRDWLQNEANKQFQAWRQSKQGKKYVSGKNPYKMGFSLPAWHFLAIEYLNKGDETNFKVLKIKIITGGFSAQEIFDF